ncbi:hypothetical protein ACK1KB_12745 [Chryseobacterium sp. TY3]
MKNPSKTFKAKAILSLTLLQTLNLNAQSINLKGPAQNLANELKGVFPYIAVCIFIVVILSNLGHFASQNGDWKKGLTNIVIFAAVLGAIVGLVSYVGNLQV